MKLIVCENAGPFKAGTPVVVRYEKNRILLAEMEGGREALCLERPQVTLGGHSLGNWITVSGFEALPGFAGNHKFVSINLDTKTAEEIEAAMNGLESFILEQIHLVANLLGVGEFARKGPRAMDLGMIEVRLREMSPASAATVLKRVDKEPGGDGRHVVSAVMEYLQDWDELNDHPIIKEIFDS